MLQKGAGRQGCRPPYRRKAKLLWDCRHCGSPKLRPTLKSMTYADHHRNRHRECGRHRGHQQSGRGLPLWPAMDLQHHHLKPECWLDVHLHHLAERWLGHQLPVRLALKDTDVDADGDVAFGGAIRAVNLPTLCGNRGKVIREEPSRRSVQRLGRRACRILPATTTTRICEASVHRSERAGSATMVGSEVFVARLG
jgi:hypothetical protein